jgi:hypothetical protein
MNERLHTANSLSITDSSSQPRFSGFETQCLYLRYRLHTTCDGSCASGAECG